MYGNSIRLKIFSRSANDTIPSDLLNISNILIKSRPWDLTWELILLRISSNSYAFNNDLLSRPTFWFGFYFPESSKNI